MVWERAALVLASSLSLGCSGSQGANPSLGSSAGGAGGSGSGQGGTAGMGAGGGNRCPDYDPLKHVYWGDLHSHTSFSADAYVFGTRTNPSDAYLFARGKPVTIFQGTGDGEE